MHVFVPTCDKYDHLMPGFAYLFNKYWSANQPVHVLHFRSLPKLPANFISVQLAEQETLPWTTHMRAYFEKMKATHFALLLDDYWFVRPVDLAQLKAWETEFVTSKADKLDLAYGTRLLGSKPWKPGYIIAEQTARYRGSLQAAIWAKDYFMKLLVPGRNIWEAEIKSSLEFVRDHATVIAPDLPHPGALAYANIYNKGRVKPGHIKRIPAEAVVEMKALGCLDFIKE